MKKKDAVRTESCKCKSCGCDYLAFTNTKEFKLKICYRCFMNGMANHFNVIKAVWVDVDIDNENKDGSWIPLGYVYNSNPVDSSDMASLNLDFKADKLEVIEELSNSEFTHVVKDQLGNLFLVIISNDE